MACFYPRFAYHDKASKKLRFGKAPEGEEQRRISCGQCKGCLEARARSLALRIMHEAKFHDHNEFVTLTYDDEHAPERQEVLQRDLQLFLKRVRNYQRRIQKVHKTIRYVGVGEYGENTERPHYHIAAFGLRLDDKQRIGGTEEKPLYDSATLSKLWGKGFVSAAPLTEASAFYIASYLVKGMTNPTDPSKREVINMETGETFYRNPTFMLQSRRPGIGFKWIERFHKDITNEGLIRLKGNKVAPVPKYYKKKLKELNPAKLERINEYQKLHENDKPEEKKNERLFAKEVVAIARRKNKGSGNI